MSKHLSKWLASERSYVVDQDGDRTIAVTGDEGHGKSSTAFWLAKLLDPTFGPERMVFSTDAVIRLAETLPKGSAIVLDEAIDGAFGQDHATRENKSFIKWLVTCRERHLFLFVLFPKFEKMPGYIRSHRARRWILVEGRGKAVFHRRSSADYPGVKTHYPKQFILGDVPFAGNVWPEEWGVYLQRKDALARRLGREAQFNIYEPEEHEIIRVSQKFTRLMAR